MEKLEKLYKDLEKYKNFDENQENTEFFLDTVDKIVLQKNPKSIGILLKYFDDSSYYDWVFESISRSLESYSIKTYVSKLIQNIPTMLIKAPVFCDNFFNRIFNSPKYLKIFRENLYLAPKESLLKLFDIMEEESPHHRELIAQLREELEKSSTPGNS